MTGDSLVPISQNTTPSATPLATLVPKGKIHPFMIANLIKSKHIFIFYKQQLYWYDPNTGIYKGHAEDIVKTEVVKLLRTANTGFMGNVLMHIEGSVTVQELPLIDPEVLHVANGILNVKTGELSPFTPDKIAFYRIPVIYDKSKNCPAIMKFLDETAQSGDLLTIQELFGFLLYRQYFLKYAVMVVGTHDTGKSKFLKLMSRFVGEENCSGCNLQIISENRFAISQLYNKFANIHADLSRRTVEDTGWFKMLTGGDTLEAELKNKNDRIRFVNYAKIIFSCNEVPWSYDQDDAYYNRWIIIKFEHEFVKNDDKSIIGARIADPNILDKITTEDELSGLLNWALVGIQRLLTTNRFTNSISVDEARKKYRHLASPFYVFCDDNVVKGAANWVAKAVFYGGVSAYYNEWNKTVLSDNAVGAALPKIIPQVISAKKQINYDRMEIWEGIALKPEIIKKYGLDSTKNYIKEFVNTIEGVDIFDDAIRMNIKITAEKKEVK